MASVAGLGVLKTPSVGVESPASPLTACPSTSLLDVEITTTWLLLA